jgi:hypothetical protein
MYACISCNKETINSGKNKLPTSFPLRFGVYTNYTHIKIFAKDNLWKKKEQGKTQQHREELMLGFAELMPNCWLEVSLHSEGPVTGQLDQYFFPGFPLSQSKC